MEHSPTFEIHPDSREVLIAGTPVGLGARAFDVLAYLDAHSDRVVSKQELLEQVWGSMVVEDGNLTVQISSLRKVLGPRAIATVPGVGYKLATSTIKAVETEGPRLPDKPSLAVLPFANLTGDPNNVYLVDGIVTDLIGSLSRISAIFVIAATSSFALKGKICCLEDVGTNLGVRYILEGSIQKAGGVFRISVQLVEAETSHTIWTQRFTGPETEIFELQDRITADVTGALEPTLLLAEAGRSDRKPTQSMLAYDLCLRALPLLTRLASKDMFEEGIRRLRAAIALDPDYTLAKAWICRGYVTARAARFISLEEAWSIMPLARELLSDVSDDPSVLAFAGHAIAYLSDDKIEGVKAVRRALGLNPNAILPLGHAAWVVAYVGAYEEALEYFRRAVRIDPYGHSVGHFRSGIGYCQLMAGDTGAAIITLEEALSEAPEFATTLNALIFAYWAAGRSEDTRRIGRKLLHIEPDLTVSKALKATPFQLPEQQAIIRAGFEGAGIPA